LERWFDVAIGEKNDINEGATEKMARKIPLPESVASQLAFRLEVA
jgi:hypothetical protein